MTASNDAASRSRLVASMTRVSMFLLSGEILYVVDHLFHLRDESGEAHLHNIEFFPIDDLPVGWHNTRCFPHNCGKFQDRCRIHCSREII